MEKTMTMVERVARAIYTKNANRSNNPNVLSWDQIPPSHRQFWCECAAAGIEEMRIPTGGMEDWFRDNLEHTETGAWIWKGAIDAALKEHEGEKG
jgi:hypothetical protein